MTEKKKTPLHGIAGGMLLYALVFFALLIGASRPLWKYLAAYEDSGANKAMDRYVQSFDETHIRAVSEPFFQQLDLGLQNEQQAFDEVVKSMSGPLRYAQKGGDELHATYAVRSDTRTLGTVTLWKEPDPDFGFSPWQVESESFDFSWLLGADEITVPDDWHLYCNGTLLDESYRTGDKQAYEMLKDFYDDSRFQLPYLVRYRVENIVGKAPFTMTDRNGNRMGAPEGYTEAELLANCSEQEQEQIKKLLDSFLPRYIMCLSNANDNAYGNYAALKPYVVEGSDIDRRVRDNIEGQTWAQSRGDTVEERQDNLLMKLGGGYYLADISYTLDTVGHQGHVKSLNNARIWLSWTDEGPLAIEFNPY